MSVKDIELLTFFNVVLFQRLSGTIYSILLHFLENQKKIELEKYARNIEHVNAVKL